MNSAIQEAATTWVNNEFPSYLTPEQRDRVIDMVCTLICDELAEVAARRVKKEYLPASVMKMCGVI